MLSGTGKPRVFVDARNNPDDDATSAIRGAWSPAELAAFLDGRPINKVVWQSWQERQALLKRILDEVLAACEAP